MLNPTWSARKQLITVHPLGGHQRIGSRRESSRGRV
jgi:hypothetical protein